MIEAGEKYAAKNFEMEPGFWTGFWSTNKCPSCSYSLNGATFLPDLLLKPNECMCIKCGNQWSVAAMDSERDRITKMVEESIRYSHLKSELTYIEDLLHGKINLDGSKR
jgi:hypothetical protein